MEKDKVRLGELTVPKGLEALDDILNGYKAYQVLAAALDVKLFDWLEQKETGTREEIIEALGINGAFARSFLQALVDMKILTVAEEQYANTELALNFLVCKSPFYQGDWLRQSTGASSYWNNLSLLLCQKEPQKDNFAAGPSADFIKSLGQRAIRGELQGVIKAVSGWRGFPAAERVLDLGGGHGLYAIALCQLNSALSGIVFDKPHVVGITKEFIAEYGLTGRLQAQAGDFCSDELDTGYDLVLMSHILYKFRKDLPAVFSKVYKSLKPGGLLVSNHWFCSPGCGAVNGLGELDKSLHSFGHPLCHVEDFQVLFGKMGFELIYSGEVPSFQGNSMLHLAVKKEIAPESAGFSTQCCSC